MIRSHTLKVWGLRLLAVVVIVGAWVFANGPGGVSPLVLPTLQSVLEAFFASFADPDMYLAAAVTFGEILAAFAVAAGLGLAAGFWAARSPLRARIFEPIFVWGYLAPLVLFYPIFILWFGTGVSSKIVFGAINAFFPIAYNSIRAFMTVNGSVLKVARAYGASAAQTDFLMKFPAALPLIRSGVRIGAAMAMITVVLAEMLASTKGLGYDLAMFSQTFAIPRAFATILLLLLLVVIMQGIVQYTLTPRRERSRKSIDGLSL